MPPQYEELPIFTREFKKLAKKYRTLSQDFITLKRSSIQLFHNPNNNFDNTGIKTIFQHPQVTIHKVKKFACKSLKGGAMSGLRLIYAYHHLENKIVFLEIYYKGDKIIEDKKRVNSYLSQLSK